MKTEFKPWIRRRIRVFEHENVNDYIVIVINDDTLGRPTDEYHISLDMAKGLAMVEKGGIGNKVRQYFLQCEETAMRLLKEQFSRPDLLESESRLKRQMIMADGAAYTHFSVIIL